MGFALRTIGNTVKPDLFVKVDDDGTWHITSVSTFKTVRVQFKLGEEFEQETADGRKVKVSDQSVLLLLLTIDKRMPLVTVPGTFWCAYPVRDMRA